MEHLFLNTLPFSFPSEPVTFYFSDEDKHLPDLHLTRLKSSQLYPLNIRSIFPKLKNGEPIYTSFDKPNDELTPLPIDFNLPQNYYLVKQYYNILVHRYFRANYPNHYVYTDYITHDKQIWVELPGDKADYPDCTKCERYNLKIDFDNFNQRPQIVLSYERTSHISLHSVAQLIANQQSDDPLAQTDNTDIYSLISKVLYIDKDNHHQFIERLEYLKHRSFYRSECAYPVLSHKLLDYLNKEPVTHRENNPLLNYFNKINNFYKRFLDNEKFRSIIPIATNGFAWATDTQIGKTEYNSKTLLFANNTSEQNPSKGLNAGPYQPVKAPKVNIFCIFHKDQKDQARVLLKSLRDGHKAYKLYETTDTSNKPDVLKRFTGKDTAFVNAYIEFENMTNPAPEVEQQLNQLFSNGKFRLDETYIALYVSPIDKHTHNATARYAYYKIKEKLLARDIALQVVNADNITFPGTTTIKTGFEYTLQNIALAICAKLGGIPWKFNVQKTNELVVGIGAFRNQEKGATYIGSAFAFDNTGVFDSFQYFLQDEIKELVGSIRDAIIRYSSANGTPDKLVIHYYKQMNQREFQQLEHMLDTLQLPGKLPVYVVTINKTESEDFVLFDAENKNALLPYSGRYINLGNGNYLLCNNTRYYSPAFPNGTRPENFPFPVKLKIICPTSKNSIDAQTIRELIEQVYRFSRIYFKSVKQQHLPVTIKYPELVSEILPYFEDQATISDIQHNLWFL